MLSTTSGSETVSASESSATAHSTDAADDQPITFRKRVDEVAVVFTVANKHGHPVKDLQREAFQVLDDHKPPRDIVSFVHQTDMPLRVGLLIDTSSSVRDRFDLEQQAASEFLWQIIRPGSDEAFVLGFDSRRQLAQDSSSDRIRLDYAIHHLKPGGGTAMFDAVYYACQEKLMHSSASTRRRAIILLSDGEDNQSSHSLAETVDIAQRAEVIIYAISTNYSNIKMRGDHILQKLAESTGGNALFPLTIKDVAHAFAQIRDELHSQYVLAYHPAEFKADGQYHTIEIVADKSKYFVRARRGYYAPAE
ncbi:MAG: VWA domain-containing protein [Acidobacteria bacterium]|nr:VWA domain-containing protein [Acidobacteriota bacterium]